jgi:hypothetical protein
LQDELTAANKGLKDRDSELAGFRRELEAAELRLNQESVNRANDATVLTRLRGELESANEALKARDAKLSDIRQSADIERQRLREEAASTLSTAKTEWSKDEAGRIEALEKKWHERSARLVAEARAEALAVGKADESSQLGRLRDELATVNRTLSDRNSEFAQFRRLANDAAERLPQQLAIAISDAQKIWSREESARIAEAESRWRAQSEQTLAEVRKSAAARTDEGAELSRLRRDLASLQAVLAERDAEFSRLRTAATADTSPKPELDAILAEAKRAWADAEAVRLATAEEEWRERSQVELSQAAARHRRAEAELAEAVSKGGEASSPRDKVEILRLRDEAENLKSTIAVRDVELAQAHATAEQLRRRVESEHVDILPPHNRGRRRNDSPGFGDRDAGAKRPILRDIALVAAVVVCGILAYPYVVELVPYDWWPGNSYSDEDSPAPIAHKPVPTQATDQPTDIVAHAANVHSGPGKTDSVVGTLDRDVGVRTIDKKGNWVHVEFSAAGGKKHDGWVFSTFLKPAPTAPAKPTAPTPER